MARFVFSLSFALLLAVFEIGSCLRCYQCNTQMDRSCGDPFYAYKYLTDCQEQRAVNWNNEYLSNILPSSLLYSTQGAPRYCHKIVMQDGHTIRTCLDVNPNDMSQTCRALHQQGSNNLKYCNVCDKDSCNGAGSIAASAPLAIVALLASYLYYKQ